MDCSIFIRKKGTFYTEKNIRKKEKESKGKTERGGDAANLFQSNIMKRRKERKKKESRGKIARRR